MATFSIVIPTLNAQGHIEKLIRRLVHLTKAVAAEIIIIDSDSRDNTKKIVMELIKEFPNVRFYKIRKKNERNTYKAPSIPNITPALISPNHMLFLRFHPYS